MGEALLIRSNNSKNNSGNVILDTLRVGDTITTMADVDSRFVKCSGQEIYSYTYPELYNAIKSYYYTAAGSAVWSAFTTPTDPTEYEIGDWFFRRKNTYSDQWQYYDTDDWIDLPYEGRPYYTSDGSYILSSGYVCSSIDADDWQKIEFDEYDPGFESIEDYNGAVENYPYTLSSLNVSVAGDYVFIHLIYTTETVTTSSYTNEDDTYSEDQSIYYQKSLLFPVEAWNIFDPIDI